MRISIRRRAAVAASAAAQSPTIAEHHDAIDPPAREAAAQCFRSELARYGALVHEAGPKPE